VNRVLLPINTVEHYKCDDVEVIAISEIYRVFVGVCFVSGGRITQPSTDIIGQVVIGRIVFLSSSDETDNGQCYALFSVKIKEVV
jgi:hypothetical protein